MEFSLNLGNAAALLGAMLLLASIPSVSVLYVLGRASAFGLRHGALAAVGIVLGDIILLSIALFGLALLSDSAAFLARGFNVFAVLYLSWLAYKLWTSAPPAASAEEPAGASGWASVAGGLALTLGDQKAVLFYLAFLPAFVDTEAVTAFDFGAIVLITFLAVGGAKFAYAYAAHSSHRWIPLRGKRLVNRAASALVAAAAAALAWKAIIAA